MSSPTTNNPSPDTPRLLCPKCFRVEVLTAEEAARHAHAGWPKCCDDVMVFLDGADPSKTKETLPDLPIFD